MYEDDNLPEALPTKLPPPFKRHGRSRHSSHLGKKLPSANYAPKNCPDPEKAWKAASMISLGKSKKAACQAVGICYSTLSRWQKSDWWDEIYLDVVRTEHGELKAAALEAALSLCASGDGATVRFLLERLDPLAFGPPKIQAEIRAESRSRIDIETTVEVTQAATPVETAVEIADILQSMGAFKHVNQSDTDESQE